MKKIIIFLLICITLCSCGDPTNNEGDVSQKSGKVNASPSAVSGSALAASPVPTENTAVSEEVTSKIVIDETGKKQKLKLGDVNIKNTIVDSQKIWFPSNYAQVVNNHYYFLRTDGAQHYTIYRDRGREAGKFSLQEGMIDEFVFYKNKFYAVIKQSFEEERGKKLVEIDLKKHKVIDICNLEFDYKRGENEFVCLNGMYKGVCYWQSENGTGSAVDLKKRKEVSNSTGLQFPQGSALIDGKMYSYEIEAGKRIQIYSWDLNSSKREKVLEFESAGELGGEDVQYMKKIKIDEDYVYCHNYLIPRRGGAITKLPDRIVNAWDNWISDTPSTTIFTCNKKFIFYMDGEGKIHRLDKKTRESIVISKPSGIQAMDIQCTENGLYIQEFDENVSSDYLSKSDDQYFRKATSNTRQACNIYYMDCNGENIKKINFEMIA